MTDKELIERLALEAARPYGSNSIQGADHIIAFAIRFLARYLAERGKEAIYQARMRETDSRFFGDWVECSKEEAETYSENTNCEMRTLFLSPQQVSANDPIGTLRYSSLGGFAIEIHAPDLAEVGMKLYAKTPQISTQAPVGFANKSMTSAITVFEAGKGSPHPHYTVPLFCIPKLEDGMALVLRESIQAAADFMKIPALASTRIGDDCVYREQLVEQFEAIAAVGVKP